MLERFIPLVRILCIGLAALILVQCSRVALSKNPVAELKIPPVPASLTNSSAASVSPTNSPATSSSKTTNTTPPVSASRPSATNKVTSSTNTSNTATTKSSTNIASSKPTSGATTNRPAPTNSVAVPPRRDPSATGTDPKSAPNIPDPRTMASRRGSGPMPGGPPGQMAPDLPPTIKSYIDRIIQSEMLGAIPRPMPMALLGIAGKDAFIRGPNGQTGLVREGDSFGGLKLLQIGTNRVLVEHEGKNQELTIFAGLGSETLMSKGKEKLP